MISHIKKLFPICRSITGSGTLKTIKYFKKINPSFKIISFKSGKKIYDWVIPLEWNIKSGYIKHIKTKKPTEYLIELCKEENKIPRLLSTESFFKEDMIVSKIKKLELQTISITSEDFTLVKELFKILGMPYYQATTEAEATGAYLCRQGIVHGVMSEDTDVMAYGSPKFITGVNTHSETCCEIDIAEVLEKLEMTYEQFRDICIMCGTDYNKNIPKIGPQKSFDLIKKLGSIDNIDEQTVYDTLNLASVVPAIVNTSPKE